MSFFLHLPTDTAATTHAFNVRGRNDATAGTEIKKASGTRPNMSDAHFVFASHCVSLFYIFFIYSDSHFVLVKGARDTP